MDTKMKPGWRTSEFWLLLAVMVLCTLVESGVLGSGSKIESVIALAGQVLGSLGYGSFRASVKKEFEKRLGKKAIEAPAG